MLERILVIGLGKLGLPMAACFAHTGYKVIGVDVNQNTIHAVNEGRPPIYEPGLAELIRESQGHLSANDSYKHAIENSEITFIVVPTPSKENGGFSTKYVETAAEQIAINLRNKDNFHIVVLTSTVLPGATEEVVKPLLEKISRKKCGVDFGLCYNPEFIALGSVIRDFTNPDVVLIGESDPKSGEILSKIYREVCENHPPVVRTSIYNAELAKISINAFITMKISFANTLAELCEKIPGGDVDTVSKILGFDSRIGRKYLSGGLAFGGPCFPRDNRAIAYFADSVGVEMKLSKATEEVNRHHNERIPELIKQRIGDLRSKKIAILGLTYKPDTDVVEESASLEITKALLKERAEVSVYDPAGMLNARKILDEMVNYASSIKECLSNAELCILATPWKEFKELKPEDFIINMKKPSLLDCWRVFNHSEFSQKMEYFAIGLNSGY